MVTTVISTNTYGSNLTYQFNTSGDIFILTEGTQLVADGYSYLYGTVANINVTIDGYLWLEGQTGGFGSPFYFYGGDIINIGESATVVLTSAFANDYAGIMLGLNGIGGTIFNNAGSITVNGDRGFVVGSGDNSITNLGTISLNSKSMHIGAGDKVTNVGTISSTTDAIIGTTGASIVINTGLINGDILLGDGADRYDGIGGQVLGTVALGDDADVYRISDAAIELLENTNEGVDRVESTVSFELGDNFEDLFLIGQAREGVGNSLVNTLRGNGLANTLEGLEGADFLFGGAGADKLYGGTGSDALSGGKGNDSLYGNEGADKFIFDTALSATTNVDKISSLSSVDRIVVDNDVFTALGAGFTSDEYRIIATGTSFASVDSSDNIVYLKSTGDLYYDQDGSGSTYSAVKFADLAANTTVNFSHFILVE